MSYYAERLNVSPKYLSDTVKRVTGHSRYCSKHLGQSPSDYRQSLQPKRE